MWGFRTHDCFSQAKLIEPAGFSAFPWLVQTRLGLEQPCSESQTRVYLYLKINLTFLNAEPMTLLVGFLAYNSTLTPGGKSHVYLRDDVM